jgi:hypothetical protein
MTQFAKSFVLRATQEIVDDYAMPAFILYPLEYLFIYFPPEKIPHAINYLKRNNLVGAKFMDWYNDRCSGRALEMHRVLLQALDKEKGYIPIVKGINAQ